MRGLAKHTENVFEPISQLGSIEEYVLIFSLSPQIKDVSENIIIEKVNGKNHIFVHNSGEKKELVKPIFYYNNEEVLNISNLYVLDGESNLIWIFGENQDGGKPNCSILYDLSGNLLAYKTNKRVHTENPFGENQKVTILNKCKSSNK